MTNPVFIEGYLAAYRGGYRSDNPHYAAANASDWDAGFIRAFGRIDAGLPSEHGNVTPIFAIKGR